MPAIFVHGVPETEHLWDGVRERLSRKDTVAVSLPGFGIPLPAQPGMSKFTTPRMSSFRACASFA